MLESQRLEYRQAQLELIRRENELELLRLSQQAEYEKKLILKKESAQADLFVVEQRIHAEKLRHETLLNDVALKENMLRQEQKESMQRQSELKNLDEKIAHQLTLKEQELAAKIKAFELEKKQWHDAKIQWHSQDVKLKQHQKQMEIDADIENKAYLYKQQLKLQDQLKLEKS